MAKRSLLSERPSFVCVCVYIYIYESRDIVVKCLAYSDWLGQALLKVPYDFHIAGNGLYTMLMTTLKDSKTSKRVSILYQL